MEKTSNKKRILIFVAIAFVLTYLVDFCIILPMSRRLDESSQLLRTGLTSATMLIPSLAVVLTRLFTKEGFHSCYIKPRGFKKLWGYYLVAWFAPSLLVLLGSLVYFLLFPGKLDPEMTVFSMALGASGMSYTNEQIKSLFVAQIIQAAVLGPVVNFVFCFGEEWGWRGYLLPKMKEGMKMTPALLLSGVIWGLWHAPLTCMGHNYGTGYPGYPITGILAMCVFCIFVGAFLSFLTLKTGSCLPAVFAHGAINSIGTIGMYLTLDGGNPFVGPGVMGIVGGIGFVLAGLLSFYLLSRKRTDCIQQGE